MTGSRPVAEKKKVTFQTTLKPGKYIFRIKSECRKHLKTQTDTVSLTGFTSKTRVFGRHLLFKIFGLCTVRGDK